MTTSIIFRYFSGNISGEDVQVSLVLLPAVAIGYLVSSVFTEQISQTHVRAAILIVSGIAAGALLVRAIAG